MAVRDEAITTGTAQQGDVRKRTAGQAPQANGGYDGKDVKEKTKEKVCCHRHWSILLRSLRRREGCIEADSWLYFSSRALLSISSTSMSF